MSKTTTIALVGTTIISSIIALNKNAAYNNARKELTAERRDNKILEEKLQNTADYLKKINVKNKKLSKRVINEINQIVDLRNSVKVLDKDLKKDKEKLVEATSFVEDLHVEKKQLEEEVLRTKELEEEISKVKQLKISNIETTLMKKKSNGQYSETENAKKVDAFKASFRILSNENADSGRRKINIKVINLKDNTFTYTNNLKIHYNNSAMDIVSVIDVERDNMSTGNYKIIIYIDGKEVNSSNIYVE